MHLARHAPNLHDIRSCDARTYGAPSVAEVERRIDDLVDVCVFYDVTGETVEVLAIVAKSEAESWLDQFGKRE